MTTYKCNCTNAAADVCTGDATIVPAEPDGSCGCTCHIEYCDDPENWRPLYVAPEMLAAEFEQERREWLWT